MRVELKLQTVTPLILGGAEQQPELRPASVRGALRYWFRAALGGVIGDDDEALRNLRRGEAEIFGDTERGSAVVVRLVPPDPDFTPADEFILPHRSQGPVKVVPVDEEFYIILSLRPRANAKALEMATWSALLLLTLGGLGRRSRRGGGSLRVKEWSSTPVDLLPQDLRECLTRATEIAGDKQVLANRIGDLLDKMRSAFTSFLPTATGGFSGGLPRFSMLLPDTRVVVWTPPGDNAVSPVTVLMNLLSARAMNRNNFRDGFGGVQPSRRASPLWVTTHLLNDDLALVLTYLKAKIRADQRGNTVEGRPSEVTNFLDSLPSVEKVEAHPLVS